MNDLTVGETLERSFKKDLGAGIVKGMNRVVSEPEVRPGPSTPPKYKAPDKPEEPRFTIEALPEDAGQRSTDNEDLVNSRSLQHLLLLKHFGIDGKPTTEEVDKLRTIWEHVKKTTDASSTAEMINAVIRLRNILGAPALDEAPLDRVYRYVQLRRIQQYEEV